MRKLKMYVAAAMLALGLAVGGAAVEQPKPAAAAGCTIPAVVDIDQVKFCAKIWWTYHPSVGFTVNGTLQMKHNECGRLEYRTSGVTYVLGTKCGIGTASWSRTNVPSPSFGYVWLGSTGYPFTP